MDISLRMSTMERILPPLNISTPIPERRFCASKASLATSGISSADMPISSRMLPKALAPAFAGVILGVGQDRIYMIDCIRFRAEFPELVKRVIDINQQMKDRYKTTVTTLIEDASAGTQVIQYVKNDRIFTPIAIKPTQDKKVRLEGVSAYIKDGTVVFPNIKGPWWDDFIEELTTFPNSTFSDQCDAFSQGLEYAVTRLKKPQVTVRVLTYGGY
ncbi:MAG: hypothetical protein EOM53_04370 [Alphaproteobacteria bacterium]|nr:hypothetical protein [Alphaproteobacteria bacterium]